MKEFVDQEKTIAEEAKVKPNPRFDRDNEKEDKDLDEEDLPLGPNVRDYEIFHDPAVVHTHNIKKI